MTDIAIVSYAQAPMVRDAGCANEVELIMPVINEAVQASGLAQTDIDFVCSGSADYLQGAPFAFVAGVDALGAFPPIKESHVEMDAAWALYECYLKMLAGDIDSALIYGFGKSSPGNLPEVLSLQLDPYYLQPLCPDSVSLAALQARAMLDAGRCTREQMNDVVINSRRQAQKNPQAQLRKTVTQEQLQAEEDWIAPLKKSDCCPISDGASALVICRESQARKLDRPYARIVGMDHRIESHLLGIRDLTDSPSTRNAAKTAGLHNNIEAAELHAPFSHQEILLRESLGLTGNVAINPSGGALAGNVMMAAGLDRIGSMAAAILRGDYKFGLAHATSGPCLQQNLVTILEAA